MSMTICLPEIISKACYWVRALLRAGLIGQSRLLCHLNSSSIFSHWDKPSEFQIWAVDIFKQDYHIHCMHFPLKHLTLTTARRALSIYSLLESLRTVRMMTILKYIFQYQNMNCYFVIPMASYIFKYCLNANMDY